MSMGEIEQKYGISQEVTELRQKVRKFIDEKIIPVETLIEERDEEGLRNP